MLTLNRSLLNKEYSLMNVLKALASIISMFNLQVTFLSKTTPIYFALFTNGIFRPFNCQLLLAPRYITSGQTSQKTRPLPSSGCPLLLRILWNVFT
jgi:hypothetical protein